MGTIAKLIVTAILSLLLNSCMFDMGVRGNGNVATENRPVSESFNAIEVSRGLDVFITQGSSESVTVEADENLLNIIETSINNGVLKVTACQNISHAASRKIFVTAKTIQSISASSGSDVTATNQIQTDHLELGTSSGSDLNLKVQANSISARSSSGSELDLEGSVNNFSATASSGSSIDAEKLIAINSQVKASSGSGITVNTQKKLTAKASSGADVKYIGNPEILDKTDGVSGSVRQE